MLFVAYFSPAVEQCQGAKPDDCVQCHEMVDDWYSEEENYDYNTSKSKGGVITHFTQVVWKESTQLDMVTAVSAGKTFYIVARYSPVGNILGRLTANVPPAVENDEIEGLITTL